MPAVQPVNTLLREALNAALIAMGILCAGLSPCLAFVSYPDVTPDKLLTAVSGGFFIGAGIGLAIRGGAVLDGTEIAALLISKNSHLLKVGDVILILSSSFARRPFSSASTRRSTPFLPTSRLQRQSTS